MKKVYLLLLSLCMVGGLNAQTITYEENFDFYDLGDFAGQSPNWRTWGGVDGAADDGEIVNTQSRSGDQSLLIDDSGVVDMLLLVPNAPTSGMQTIQWWAYIPAGRGGYFNMQAELTAGGTPWNQTLMGGNNYYNCDGSSGGTGITTGVIDCSSFSQDFTYPEDEWFFVKCIYDLDNEAWSMEINGEDAIVLEPFIFNNQTFVELAAINFFSASSHNEMYIDDLTVAEGVLNNDDFSQEAFKVYPNPVRDMLNIATTGVVESVIVYDVLGKVVLQAQPDRISPSIDMSALTSGAYLLRVTVDGVAKTVKVVK